MDSPHKGSESPKLRDSEVVQNSSLLADQKDDQTESKSYSEALTQPSPYEEPTARTATAKATAEKTTIPIGSPKIKKHHLHPKRDVVGLKTAAKRLASDTPVRPRRREFLDSASVANLGGSSKKSYSHGGRTISVEEHEEDVRSMQIHNPVALLVLGFYAAFKVMFLHLINLATILSCCLTVALTLYWYDYGKNTDGWHGGGMDYVLLAFAVTSPIAAAIGMAYNRREMALLNIADFRSFASQLYTAHSLWDWSENGGRTNSDVDLRAHCDAVLAQIVGISDELARFLTLPTTSRSIHRMTRIGRRQAAETVEVAYRLTESMSHRLTRLCVYGERIKAAGLASGEVSRIRQYERFLEDCVERLRMIKMYRTPQAFRSFARIFTFILPPFYAPTYAQVGIDLHSLGMGVAFGIITTIGLTALFESLQVLEDPFVGFLALDGIDVREEFQVLLWSSLVGKRRQIFSDAPPYPMGRRRALTDNAKIVDVAKEESPLVSHIRSQGASGQDTHVQAPVLTDDINSTKTSTIDDVAQQEVSGVDGLAEAFEFGPFLDDGEVSAGDSSNATYVRESNFKLYAPLAPSRSSSNRAVNAPSPFARAPTKPPHRRNQTIA